ncbi:related to Protein required for hyphal anastomosis (HAM-2) [Cephalotrichum gorgonifer]|uniref:Related to Protein required for hyphal anastomosis (HAM-2) n=1 Tax=Cephalotrichum gorgonifer TaxID=2041049 RepID=A0AAE8MUD1_9PEZI|nr:related to Protein required for hyphal anastomosis (HAM-2) [Cephalotrichum gorgonifer]
MGIADEGTDPPRGRPLLTRNQSVPPQAPAPPQSAGGAMTVQQATDSLSLLQLRRLVSDIRQTDPVAYDFTYSDTGPHGEEIDEWFVYMVWQWIRLNGIQKTFEWQWQEEFGARAAWENIDEEAREQFVAKAVRGLRASETSERLSHISKIAYIVLGRWGDTAVSSPGDEKKRCAASEPQLAAIGEGVKLLTALNGHKAVWQALRSCFELFWNDSHSLQQTELQMAQEELLNLMTILYVSIQATLSQPDEMAESKRQLLALSPSLPTFLLVATSKLRWDDGGFLPQAQLFLLFWKSLLLVLGGTEELAEVKRATSETPNDGKERDIITASPLDYHAFRQEITSKYPSYIPPPSRIPLEAENTSLLPPLPNQSLKSGANVGVFPTPSNQQSGGGSILHQPVHIATPAPSPPPSPAIGGKGGKKQNYQTNQNFPFLYPPLDATSNSAGGKGEASFHGQFVTRKWEGSDIPASILEAGEIFSKRVRMTRATRQLWEERETFLKFDRGWDPEKDGDDGDDEDDIEDLFLDELSEEERKEIEALRRGVKEKPPAPSNPVDFGPNETLSDEVRRQLIAVEELYSEALPNLQSIVIVLLKAILQNVTAIIAQGASQQHPGVANRGPNGNVNGGQPGGNGVNGGANSPPAPELSIEDVDAARTREITAKAATGIILLMLKWFKVSHTLKFEYMTQLLLDSNYIPLVLKLFAHQDIQQVVDSKMDRVEHSFFRFCNLRSRTRESSPPPLAGTMIDEDSEDDAAPPPIKFHRSPPPHEESGEFGAERERNPYNSGPRPEVDELGYPTTDLPKEPITDFSRRNFFSLINYLRIMQKVCKNKAHRNLLLVSYKSSNILRKSLKVPQPELRLYTLKLFKNQVPYCGRKWRQGNMRVITAVYLHCRPELRDEWLAGSDVDAEVDSAVPLEQALRGLTHWFNVRRYPEGVAPGVRAAVREEQDFFAREVERLEVWGEEEPEWDQEGMMGYA